MTATRLLTTRKPAARGHSSPGSRVDRMTARHTVILAEAIDRLSRATEAQNVRIEAHSAILARVESHLAQEGRWTASAVLAVTAAHHAAEAEAIPVQSHRPTQVRHTKPGGDAPRIGLLAQLSSDLARLTDDGELTVEAVALTLNMDSKFTAVRERMDRHAPPVSKCPHVNLDTCLPMLRWLAADMRFAQIASGLETAEALFAAHDAAQDAARDGASVEPGGAS